MSNFNQTSPLLQNASTFGQQNNGTQGNYAPFGAQPFGNQQRSSFGAQNFGNHQCPSFGAQAQGYQQQWNGNQFQNQGYGQNQGNNQRNQANALREVEQRAQQSQDALYQERQQGNNYQAIRQTADIIANNADISRHIIEYVRQEIRNCQQYANSPMERQAYQQREQQLEQLAQVKDQLRYLSQQRANAQDNGQRENLTEQLIELARHAQNLTRNIINETQNQRNGSQIQTPFYPQNYDGNRQGNFDNASQNSQNQGFRGNFLQPSLYNYQ
ncbi:hypothetical protein DSO57_1016242 [Entomophthora muscae]|uniref:Uncharacterized protein n=1 Tax=Entomophthora muscae TaxID=34485 RepID=A0ACC2S6W9_9FUNG|nr:hypothetical protein DSO57_1016242 [Entomophthora muscae]